MRSVHVVPLAETRLQKMYFTFRFLRGFLNKYFLQTVVTEVFSIKFSS